MSWRRWFEPLKLELAIFQGLDQPLDHGNTLCRFGLVCRTKFERAIGLKFLRAFAERLSDTFLQLQFRFRLCSIAIGKPFLAKIVD